MPLPSSGPLSLNDIAGEFGGSTPHSLSEYYAGGGLVPAGTSGTYGAVPSSGTISIRNFYGTSNIVYFITNYVNSTTFEPLRMSVSSDGSPFWGIWSGVNFSGSGGQGATFALTNAGTNNWNRFYSTDNFTAGCICDPSGNVFVIGNGGSYSAGAIAKLNSSGTVQWVRINNSNSFIFAGTSGVQQFEYATDNSGNVYARYRSYSPVFTDNSLVKIDSNGNLIWHNSWPYDFVSTGGPVSVSPNGTHIWITGVNASYNLFIIRLDSSGNIQYQNALMDCAQFLYPQGQTATDNSGNLYLAMVDRRLYPNIPVIQKFDVNGNRQWGYRVTSASSSTSNGAMSVAYDSSLNVYVSYAVNSTTVMVMKFNASGTLQWARTFSGSISATSGSGNFDRTNWLAIDGSDNLYVGLVGSNNAAVFAKFPNDGSKTGTYTVGSNTYTWASASPTLVSTTYSRVGTSIYSIPSSSFPWSASSLSPSSASLTVTRTLT